MATSSIFHNVIIRDEAAAERFIAALEASEADPYMRPEGPVAHMLTDKDEIRRQSELRRKNRSAGQ